MILLPWQPEVGERARDAGDQIDKRDPSRQHSTEMCNFWHSEQIPRGKKNTRPKKHSVGYLHECSIVTDLE